MVQEISLNKVYGELKKIERNMATKEEINRLLETFEIISNKNTMKQVERSEQDIKLGKVKEIKSVSDI